MPALNAGSATPAAAGTASLSTPAPGTAPAAGSSAQSSDESVIDTLKKIVAEARTAFAGQGTASRYSVDLSVQQQVGAILTDQSGSKSLLYTRPTGDTAIMDMPGVSVKA